MLTRPARLRVLPAALSPDLPRLAEPRYRLTWWLATRALIGLVALGMMFHHDWKHIFDDLNVYAGWGALLAEGQVPLDDPMWQYPPLAAFVFGGVGLIGTQPWLFAVLFVAVDIAISRLLARDAGTRGRWDGYAIWLFAPLLIGPILYGRYDVIPTLAAMAGLLALAVPLAAGAILAVGGALKVWPAVMALALSQRDWLRGAAGAVLTTAVVLVTAAWAFPGVGSSFLGNGEARGLQTESVAALPFVWARMFLGRDGIPEAFRYGSSEVGVPLADAIAPWLIPLTAVGLLALIVARALGRLDHAPVADIAFVAIVWLMVTSRVLSPQYNVWLVGMVALVWAAGSARMRRVIVPVAITALAAQALYPFAYIDIIDGGFIGTAVQTTRIVALVWALVLAVRALRPEPVPAPAEADPGAVPGSPPGRA
ncbi:MAG: glycosyltransferase 87 family protein [Candidatus Nanopelagicales bacterium]